MNKIVRFSFINRKKINVLNFFMEFLVNYMFIVNGIFFVVSIKKSF